MAEHSSAQKYISLPTISNLIQFKDFYYFILEAETRMEINVMKFDVDTDLISNHVKAQ
jgi:hypothetical protein